MALRRTLPLLLVLALMAAAVLVYQASLPVMQGSDEAVHFNYAMRLMTAGGLPDRASYLSNETRQASGQPPLAYLFYALWGQVLHLEPIDGTEVLAHLRDDIRNPWYQPHRVWNRTDNLAILMHGDDDARGVREAAFGWPDLVRENRLLRLAGFVWSLIAVLAAYGAARAVFAARSWALTAALLFGLMPTMPYISSYVTNDTAATALGTCTIWGALYIVRRGSRRALLLTGLALALGALAKVNVLLLAPAVGLAVILSPDFPARPIGWHTLKSFVWHGLLVVLPLLVLLGPWLAWGLYTYGDPFGFNTHRHDMAQAFSSELHSLAEIIPQLSHTYLSYLGWFDTVPLHPLTYTALGLVVVLALVGLWLALVRLRFWSSVHRRQALVLAAVFLLMLIGMIRWMQQLSFTGGRLMYPAHAAVILALTAGLYALWRRWPRLGRVVQAYAVVVVAVSGIVLGPLAIRAAFAAPPRLSQSALPALMGGPVEFTESEGEAPFLRLLGVAFPAGERITSDTLPLALCWQALAQPRREPAFSAKLIAGGEIAADRTSLFGLGRYPSALWQPGDIWCDTFDLWLDDPDVADEPPLRPGQRYDLVVTVLDADTQASNYGRARDGVAIDAVILGSAVSPAGQMPAGAVTAADIAWPGFARLTGYRVDGPLDSGATPALTLVYAVDGAITDSLAAFVHLYRGGEFVAVLADGVPRAGRYPTVDWRPGEQVVDTWTLALPADLLPGDYSIRLGWYDPATGQRRPAVLNGGPVPDASATLLSISLP